MKTSITEAERQRIAEWLLDAQQMLATVDALGRHIAETLGLDPTHEHDAITDALWVPRTVDQLLLELRIDVEETDWLRPRGNGEDRD